MNLLKRLVVALVVAFSLALAAGQIGLLKGSTPDDLGVRDGRLKAPANVPNSVSSQARLHPGHRMSESAAIAPLEFLPSDRDGRDTLAELKALAEAMPGATVVTSDPSYLYVQFSRTWFRLVDDAEFWVDPQAGVIQVRSAARLGETDLGANRDRIEAIRQQLAAPR